MNIKTYFKLIRDNLSFEQVLIDITASQKKGNVYQCPFCDKKGKFSILNDEYGKCGSDKCNGSGDIVKLYSQIKEIEPFQAIHELIKKYSIDVSGINELERNDTILKKQIQRYYTSKEKQNLKYNSDLPFIDLFRVFILLNDITITKVSVELGISRKDLSNVLNKNYNSDDMSLKKGCSIIELMKTYYFSGEIELMNKINLAMDNEKMINQIHKMNEYCKRIYKI